MTKDHDVAVDVDRATHVATVEIRRGPNNYFDIAVLARVADLLDELAAGDTRAVVLCSEGKHFCAGADTLPVVVGHQAAIDLLYTGRRIDGTTAHRIGLCDKLVSKEELRPRAAELAGEVASAAPLALRSIRQTMRGSLAGDVRAAMTHERAEQERLQRTDDFREGVAAVGERRPARFTGR